MYSLKISCIGVLFLAFNFSFGQPTGKVTYAVEHLEQYTNPRISKRNVDGSLKRIFKFDSIAKAVLAKDEVLFQLDFNPQYYHFYVQDVDEKTQDVIRRFSGGIKHYFFDVGANSFIFRYKLEDHDHLVESEAFYSKNNWHITDETREIAGYTCKKAILTNQMESLFETYAWFTEDISIDFGPLGYMSLPGIILGLEHNHRFIYALEVDLDYKPNIKLPAVQSYTITEHHDLLYGDILQGY